MNEHEKRLEGMRSRLSVKYGNHKISEVICGYIHAYRESLPFWTRKLWDVHYERCLDYVSKRLEESFPVDDHKWK